MILYSRGLTQEILPVVIVGYGPYSCHLLDSIIFTLHFRSDSLLWTYPLLRRCSGLCVWLIDDSGSSKTVCI